MNNRELRIKIDKGNSAEELRQRIIDLLNEYAGFFTDFEILGILDVVKSDCYNSMEKIEGEI